MDYFKKHLVPAIELLVFIGLFWLMQKAPLVYFVQLLIGFVVGNIILELDHIIYWYLLKPDCQQSQIAKHLIKHNKIRQLVKLIGNTATSHTSLIFHHIAFQLILLFVSFFVFTSTSGLLTKTIVFFASANLLTKQLCQLSQDKSHLQKWLFARLDKQLPKDKLPYYIYLITGINLIFLVKLISL